jgi:hypothetical protein
MRQAPRGDEPAGEDELLAFGLAAVGNASFTPR